MFRLRKGVPAPPFLRRPPLDPACLFFSKSLFPFPSFPIQPPFKSFQTVPPTLTQYPNSTHQPSLHIMKGLYKYQNGDFTSSIVAFYQESILDFLNPFTNISGYLNLWDIFRFIFRELRMTYVHKIMVAEKNNFSANE